MAGFHMAGGARQTKLSAQPSLQTDDDNDMMHMFHCKEGAAPPCASRMIRTTSPHSFPDDLAAPGSSAKKIFQAVITLVACFSAGHRAVEQPDLAHMNVDFFFLLRTFMPA